MEFLYRGVSQSLYEKLNGKLTPKIYGEVFSSTPCAGDPHAVCGSGIVAGKAVINSIVFHQWEQKGFPTSGISTTPFIERAKYYALSGTSNTNGYIYKLSIIELNKSGVSLYRVNEHIDYPAIREDDEHILVDKDFKEIPIEAIISVQPISKGF